MDNIMNTATDNIPKTTYKLKPAFTESTKTKKTKNHLPSKTPSLPK